MDSTKEILFETVPGNQGQLGLITLNRPQVLNSLNLTMILALHQQLAAWADDQSIKAVAICAAPGRAFCAGGDLRLTHQLFTTGEAMHFFQNEYRLNRFIHHYPKPYIALLDGITMGGGVGISIHGSHRVATEKLIFAMPETGIGFFPDVGGTYFLPRLREHIGFYLGLVGLRLGSDDCVDLGIAQYKVLSEQLQALVMAIAEEKFTVDAKASVSAVISRFAIHTHASDWLQESSDIHTCFSRQTIEQILTALQQAQNVRCQEAWQQLMLKSPTSLKVTLRALQNGKKLDFDACMDQEAILARHFSQGHDFIEGIRSVIIDKDQNPRWEPNRLDEVTETTIDKYFLAI